MKKGQRPLFPNEVAEVVVMNLSLLTIEIGP